jgi:hypothetical protein
VPTSKFAHYQLTKALPWWFKRWVCFDKSATLEPLYTYAGPLASDPHKLVRKNSAKEG